MKFILIKESETGRKLQEVIDRKNEAFDAAKNLSEKYGAVSWRPGYFTISSGVSSLIFEEEPDGKFWKRINHDQGGFEYMPKLNIKEGKSIQKEIDGLPVVSWKDLNSVVGWDGYHTGFKYTHIGFNVDNDEHFGIQVGDSWGIDMPKDCEEVTTKVYNEMFKID